jgi:hypothetical protein
MATRVNPSDTLIVDQHPSEDLPVLYIATNIEGTILPSQIEVANTLAQDCSVLVAQIPDLLDTTTRTYIEEELIMEPTLAGQVRDFRGSYPFPTGEFRHVATEISNIHWKGLPFAILSFEWSWSNEHSARVLTHKNLVLGVRFYLWTTDEMIQAATRASSSA